MIRFERPAVVAFTLALLGCDAAPPSERPLVEPSAGKADDADDPCLQAADEDACIELGCEWIVRAADNGGDVCIAAEPPSCEDLVDEEACVAQGCEWIVRAADNGGDVCIAAEAPACEELLDENDCLAHACEWIVRGELNGGDVCVPA